MARRVRLNEFQAMQRGEGDALGDSQIGEYDVVERDPLTGGMMDAESRERDTNAAIEAFDRGDDEIDQDWEATERLKAIGAGSLPAEHEYDVAPDGAVKDWREVVRDRADSAEEPEPTVHTITDDEPRFSGAGDGSSEAQQQSLFMVPNDSDFRGKLYREAPELAQLASDLIERHGYLEHLEHCTIRYFWKRKTGVTKGQRQTGGLKRGSDLLGHLLGTEFAIYLAADTARERQFSDRRVERSLFRQLRRIGQDDKGNWIELPFTLQVFTEEIKEYADVGDEDLKVGHSAFKNADQMGLFDPDDDDSDDESDEDDDEAPGFVPARMATADGAGVLIHADGTPLSGDEIEAMERHDLDDDPTEDDEDLDAAAFDADRPLPYVEEAPV